VSEKNYIFGPVPSRRLGRSLGVDLVPFKTCTYDCIYCQLGQTTNKTLVRKEWVPANTVIEQTRDAVSTTEPDFITLSGSGEPTLNSSFGRIITEIKSFTDIPVALLTNGSLLWQEDVRDAAALADLVIPSLDAGSEDCFRKVNRPCEGLSFEQMIDGLMSFRSRYDGEVWLEVFLLAGLNATESEIPEMIRLAERMNFNRIQLNTVSRPACESYAFPVPENQLLRYSARFGPNAEIIADYSNVHEREQFKATGEQVLDLLRHRPCTVEGISDGLAIHRNEAVKYIEDLLSKGKISMTEHNGLKYYSAATPDA